MSRLLVLLAVVTGLLVAACGGEGSATGGPGDGIGLSISAPDQDAQVQVPFTVKLASNVPLGQPGTGEHHAHIFFDGDDSNYILAYGDSVRIDELPPGVGPGKHTMNASLRHADHSAAGVETQIDLTIDPSPGSQSGASDDTRGFSY